MKHIESLRARESAGSILPSQTNPPYRILVVDDDISIRQLSNEALIRSGYQVDVAEDGAVAWDTLQLNNFDLLITDHNMPKLSGVELLKKLRAARMALPLIMATAAFPTHEFAPTPWLKPDATLLKPYTFAELLGKVDEVLRATDVSREQIEPTPNSQGLPSVVGLRP